MLSVALFCFALSQSAPTPQEITSLPGFNGALPSKQYGGYISVSTTKFLYYYFIESEHNPATDPVVLWLNGGPGCSSFDGFVYEHGPYIFTTTANNQTSLTKNPYSWAMAANMLYIDSPAGVGLSYSNNPKVDLKTNDTQVANDLNSLLRQFFEMFPAFQKNEFFVSGESYGGVYVPSTAQRVLHGNQQAEKPMINMVGILVGNGVTDEVFDGNAFPPFAAGVSLISETLYKQLEMTCGGNYYNASGACQKLLDEAYAEVSALNIYDVLEPCPKRLTTGLGRDPRRRDIGRAWPLRANLKPGARVPSWHELLGGDEVNPPCIESNIASNWLNSDAVRTAIHAVPVSKQKWEICTGSPYFDYTHDKGSMIPVHKELLAAKKRVLIYSGDHDMCVPHTGSEAWTSSLGMQVDQKWHPWKSESTPTHTSPAFPGQVAGYTRSYVGGLSYATIKGAGHTVPEYKPAEAYTMFSKFIADQPL